MLAVGTHGVRKLSSHRGRPVTTTRPGSECVSLCVISAPVSDSSWLTSWGTVKSWLHWALPKFAYYEQKKWLLVLYSIKFGVVCYPTVDKWKRRVKGQTRKGGRNAGRFKRQISRLRKKSPNPGRPEHISSHSLVCVVIAATVTFVSRFVCFVKMCLHVTLNISSF